MPCKCAVNVITHNAKHNTKCIAEFKIKGPALKEITTEPKKEN